MSIFTKLAQLIFAPVDENGTPRSVNNQDVQVWGTEVERLVDLFVAGGSLIYSTRAALFADLAHAANSMAWVLGDSTAAYNGIYGKVGASGSGSWARRGDLPFSFIVATDAGAGTPNAIQATTAIPVSASSLIWMNIADTNTASPVTVSFNGGSALTIKANGGNDVVAGGLVSGMIVLGMVSGTTFRLLSDQASTAILAAAEAALAAAEALVQAAAYYPSRSAAIAATVPEIVETLWVKAQNGMLLNYRSVPGVTLNPALTTNGGTRAWLPAVTPHAPDFWADNVTPGTTDMLAAISNAMLHGPTKMWPATTYAISAELPFADGYHLEGAGGYWKRRTGYDYATDPEGASVIKYIGATGDNTCAVRISQTAVGVAGSDFAGPETDDLVNVVAKNFHIDANGADFGCYIYRAGNQSNIDGITVEGAAYSGHTHLGCFAAFFGVFAAYECQNMGAIIGYDIFGWGGGESPNFAYNSTFHVANNGQGGAFVENSTTSQPAVSGRQTLPYDLYGCGALIRIGRGSRVNISSESNLGRAYYGESIVVGGADGGPTVIIPEYIEGNSAGPLLVQSDSDGGLVVKDGFFHPGNGGSLAKQTIKIEGRNNSNVATTDAGSNLPDQWILLENLKGLFEVNSNTDKYRVENCQYDITFSSRRPTEPFVERQNEMINGDFSVWQRGAGPFSADGYTADRWYAGFQGGTGTVSQEAITVGSLEGFDAPSPEYCLNMTMTVGAANAGMTWRAADVRKYAGRRIIVSFWGAVDALKSIRVDATQNFGSGGSTAVTTVGLSDPSVSTTFRRHSVAIDLPSISGKTIGTDSYLGIRFRYQGSGTFTLKLAAVKIEMAAWGPSLYRQKPKSEEFAACSAYFNRLVSGIDLHTGFAGQAISATAPVYSIRFPRMRKTPTLSVSSAAHFSALGSTGADIALSALSLSQANDQSGRLVGTVAAGLTAGNATLLRSTNASATLDLVAEV
ncbi:hypothetical protein EDE05_12813 [Neorhizobium sp. R1-B]|uniref:hypothetical protein n=1 Tax=Neorhizobium sp. R1-B TaxID=2485162 RepID=UPI0010DF30C1|nr:hypothetical protein [Neorhizobium sp. R1-B]TDX72592.1 hypothetical protein EDE05_12813 [Neorhizobium sp. R1-B]